MSGLAFVGAGIELASMSAGLIHDQASRAWTYETNTRRTKELHESWPLEPAQIIELTVHGWLFPESAQAQIRSYGFDSGVPGNAFFQHTALGVGFRPNSLAQFEVSLKGNGIGNIAQPADHLFFQAQTTPELEQLLTLRNRNNISDDVYKFWMHKLGIRDEGVQVAFDSLRNDMLGASDLIRLAVRDAFYPDIVAAYGEANEYPQILDKYMSWVGLGWDTGYPAPASVDANGVITPAHGASWGELLWYAHWEFPSASQAYDMMHMLYADSPYGPSPYVTDIVGNVDKDKVFTDVDLNRLLRASGYSTYWRDKLAAIADPPLTRVDLRRMHASGVIGDGDVYHNYRAQGYNDRNAQQLTKYTIIKERPDISKQVCQLFQLGFLDEDGAVQTLMNNAMDKNVAQGHIQQCKLEQQISVSQAIVKRIHSGFLNGTLDEGEARSALSQLGSNATQVNTFMAQWIAERLFDHKMPVRTEILQWYADGMLNREDTITRLQKLGYSDSDVSYYLTQQDARNAAKRLKQEEKDQKEQQNESLKQTKAEQAAAKQQMQRIKQAEAETKKAAKEQQAAAKQAKADAKAATTDAKQAIAQSVKGIDASRLKVWYVAGEITESQLISYLGLLGWSAEAIGLYVQELNREIGIGSIISGPGTTPEVGRE